MFINTFKHVPSRSSYPGFCSELIIFLFSNQCSNVWIPSLLGSVLYELILFLYSNQCSNVFITLERPTLLVATSWAKRGGREVVADPPPPCVSGCRPDSSTIPTAIPVFSGSRNSIMLIRTLPDVTGSQKSKMASTKP